MNDLTLATLIEQKFRAEKLDDQDAYKYIKNDWLIDVILNLLNKHPRLKEKIKINDMSISKIMAIIEAYFKDLQKKRVLNRKIFISFITDNDQFRRTETFILLLILGFSFNNAFKRMNNNNNNKQVGDILEIEPSFSGVSCNVNYQIPMPQQILNAQVKTLYELVCNSSASAEVVERYFQYLQQNLKNKPEIINAISVKKATKNK